MLVGQQGQRADQRSVVLAGDDMSDRHWGLFESAKAKGGSGGLE